VKKARKLFLDVITMLPMRRGCNGMLMGNILESVVYIKGKANFVGV
jgi:hypothetical protein